MDKSKFEGDIVIYEHVKQGSPDWNGAIGRVMKAEWEFDRQNLTVVWLLYPPGGSPKVRPNPCPWNVRVLGNEVDNGG